MSKRALYITSIIFNLLLDVIVSIPAYYLFWSRFWIFSFPVPPLASIIFNKLYMKADTKKRINRTCIGLRMTGYIILNTVIAYVLVYVLTIAMIKITGKSR